MPFAMCSPVDIGFEVAMYLLAALLRLELYALSASSGTHVKRLRH